MTGYIALLRGINVGGHKKIPMAQLRELFSELGFPGARTYIQSGNVVFDGFASREKTRASIEAGIADRFGFDVPVIVRSRAELDAIIEADPFTGRELEPSKVVVTFLADRLSESVRELVVVPDGLPEEAVIAETELYIYYPDGMGKSKLDRSPFWKPLGAAVTTTRNWRTVLKLRDMVTELGLRHRWARNAKTRCINSRDACSS